MADQYKAIQHELDTDSPYWKPTEERYAAAIHDLSLGRDITWNYHLRGDTRVFVAAVCCPNGWEDTLRCPLDALAVHQT
ncbi:hypothetical protein [Salinactinospora qingdaonensis]